MSASNQLTHQVVPIELRSTENQDLHFEPHSAIETPKFGISHQVTRCRSSEVCTDDESRRRTVALDERNPGLPRLVAVTIGEPRKPGLRELNRMVDKIPRNNGVLALGGDAYAHVARGVAGRRFEPDFIGDSMIRRNQPLQARLRF